MAFDLKKSLTGISEKLKFKKPEGSGKKSFVLKLKNPKIVVAIVAGIVVIFLTTMGVGIYVFSWQDGFTSAVTQVVPYPAAIVNNRIIFYHTYLDQLSIVETYQKEFKKVDFKTEDGKKVLTQIRKETMDRLVEDTLVSAEASRLKVTITEKELTDSFNQLVKSNGGETSFASVLEQYYGLTPTEFKNEIYKTRLLRQKVAEKFSSDETVNADAKAKAEEVLAKVKAGEDFATLAAQYSQDTTASAGGDLGPFGKGKMVPEFETAAFALKAGEVSELVKTVYGYHIIKVTEVKGEEIRASHILIKTKDFNTWLTDALKTVNKNILIPSAK